MTEKCWELSKVVEWKTFQSLHITLKTRTCVFHFRDTYFYDFWESKQNDILWRVSIVEEFQIFKELSKKCKKFYQAWVFNSSRRKNEMFSKVSSFSILHFVSDTRSRKKHGALFFTSLIIAACMYLLWPKSWRIQWRWRLLLRSLAASPLFQSPSSQPSGLCPIALLFNLETNTKRLKFLFHLIRKCIKVLYIFLNVGCTFLGIEKWRLGKRKSQGKDVNWYNM